MHSLQAKRLRAWTFAASTVVSCGRKKFRVSFSGTDVGASASSSVFGTKLEGNSGGFSVEETCGVNFLRNSARQNKRCSLWISRFCSGQIKINLPEASQCIAPIYVVQG